MGLPTLLRSKPFPSRAARTRQAESGGGRMVWMDQARGLAIVLVVVFHGRTVQARFGDVPVGLRELTEFFDPFRMPLLVFLSGMLLTQSLAKPPAAYALGKVRGIAWPYLVWSVAFLAVTGELSADGVVAVLGSPLSHLWYLPYLLGYYALSWVLHALRVPFLPVALAALATAALVDGGWRRMTFLFACFAAGHLYVQRRRAPSPRAWLVVGATAMVLAGGLANVAGVEVKYDPLLAVVPAAGIVLCLLLAPLARGGAAARALACVGRQSLVFYVSHFVTLWLVHSALAEAGGQDPFVLYLLGVSTAFGVGALLVSLRRRSRVVDALFLLPWPSTVPGRTSAPATRRADDRGVRR